MTRILVEGIRVHTRQAKDLRVLVRCNSYDYLLPGKGILYC